MWRKVDVEPQDINGLHDGPRAIDTTVAGDGDLIGGSNELSREDSRMQAVTNFQWGDTKNGKPISLMDE